MIVQILMTDKGILKIIANRIKRDHNPQNHSRRDQRDNRQQAAKPRVDFKARATAIKAEQMLSIHVKAKNEFMSRKRPNVKQLLQKSKNKKLVLRQKLRVKRRKR